MIVRVIGIGLGMALGVALWPLLLPVAILLLLARLGSRKTPRTVATPLDNATSSPRSSPAPLDKGESSPQSEPMLLELRARELAKVDRRNREHLQRCFDRMFD